MPIRHVKNTSHLIARTKIRARRRRHYLLVYLWGDQESMQENSVGLDGTFNTLGAHCPNDYSYKFDNFETWEGVRWESPPLLGEIHLIQGRWTEEIVAHELCHALLHRLRAVGPPVEVLISQNPMEAEEAVCHEFGQWFREVYHWLWKVDPSDRWEGTREDEGT